MNDALKKAVTETRLKMLANGWTPIRNKDKRTFMKGWPNAHVTEEEILRWERWTREVATGVRIENGLAAIDFDIDDEGVMREIADEVMDAVPVLADENYPLPIRFGKGFKEAWFVRTEEPFVRITTRSWVAPGETEDERTQRVEIFGGAAPRQFGVYGPHSYDEETGKVAVLYRWHDLGPTTVRVSELPVLTKDQFFAVCDAAERVLERHGWDPVLRSQAGEGEGGRVYDLTEGMVFECDDEVDRTLEEAREWAAAAEGGRCSASWLEGPAAKNRQRCLVSVTRSGHLAVWESAAGVTHVEAVAEPTDWGVQIDRVQEKLQELQDRRKRKIRGSDEMLVAAAKMREAFAYWPRGGGGNGLVVPIWASSLDEGTPVTAFRTQHLPNCAVEIGPRGGEKKINPVDVWMADTQRITVDGLRMRPDQPRPTFEEDGRTYINVYDPPIFMAEGGDAQPGFDFIDHLLPDATERHWFLQWLSFKLQHPHIPGPAVVMVAHGVFGTGRGTLGHLLGKLFGTAYVHSLPFNDLTGKTSQSQYNEWQAEALLVVVNESSESHDGSVYQTKRNTYEHLKEMVEVRPAMRSIKVKGLKNYRALSSTSFLIATNHADALPIPANDRRFCVLQNGGTQPDRYWHALNRWMEDEANLTAFYDALLAYDIADYSPFAPPPTFEGKMRMVEEGKSDLDQALDLVEETFNGPLFTIEQVCAVLRQIENTEGLVLPKNTPLEGVVKRLAPKRWARVGVKDGPGWRPQIDGKRGPVYALDRATASRFRDATAEELRREIIKNGGRAGVGEGGAVVALARLRDPE